MPSIQAHAPNTLPVRAEFEEYANQGAQTLYLLHPSDSSPQTPVLSGRKSGTKPNTAAPKPKLTPQHLRHTPPGAHTSHVIIRPGALASPRLAGKWKTRTHTNALTRVQQ